MHTRYDGIAAALAESGYAATESVDGVLFDLGVSSMQLDRVERGFSYSHDAPLDMRMDPEAPLTAADILNTYDEAALTDILRRYGEERFASPDRRAHRPPPRAARRSPRPGSWSTCSTKRFRRRPGAPAGIRPSGPSRRCASRSTASWTRCATPFPAALDALTVGGRVVVMAYQSLEDRIVKQHVRRGDRRRARRSGLPVELPGDEPKFTVADAGGRTGRSRRGRTQPAERGRCGCGPCSGCKPGRSRHRGGS